MNIRKTLIAAVSAIVFVSSAVAIPAPASAAWLVRGYPLRFHMHHHGHRRYYVRRGFYGRNIRSGFFLPCAGTYGIPIC